MPARLGWSSRRHRVPAFVYFFVISSPATRSLHAFKIRTEQCYGNPVKSYRHGARVRITTEKPAITSPYWAHSSPTSMLSFLIVRVDVLTRHIENSKSWAKLVEFHIRASQKFSISAKRPPILFRIISEIGHSQSLIHKIVMFLSVC